MISYLKSAFNVFKKVILVVLVYLIVIGLFSHFIGQNKINLQSKNDPIKQTREEIYKTINDKDLNKTESGRISIALYRGIACKVIGEGCSNNPADGDKNYSKSVFGFVTNLIIAPYVNPPASGVVWAYSGLQNAGFVPKTLAAEGIGFAAIKPLSNLWKVFRDLSYMLLVIVLIAIGFMIMFRAKINPQTVISVENALPKIVIALILITFSFAIAGFLIDFTYVLIALVISVISNNNTFYDAGKYTNDFLTAGPWQIIESTKFPGLAVGDAFLSILGGTAELTIRTVSSIFFSVMGPKYIYEPLVNLVNNVIAFMVNQNAATFNASLLGVILSPLAFGIMSLVGVVSGFFLLPGLIVSLLIGFTIIALFFRIFFMLFSSYLKILLFVIFAPLILLFEAVPTGKSAFSWWFKSLLVELLNFPVLIALLLVARIIQQIPASGTKLWSPPFLLRLDPNALSLLIGMMFFALIPNLMKLIRELMGVKDLPIPIGFGTLFGGAGGAVGGAVGGLTQFGSIALALKSLPGGEGLLSKFTGLGGGKTFEAAAGMFKRRTGGATGGVGEG